MKMKKSDIGVVAFMYLVCLFFYIYMQELPKDSQTYPLFTIALLFGLTTLYLITMIVNAVKNGTENGMEAFRGFVPVQFLFCFAMVVLYLVGIKYLGFFSSTVIFMIAVMAFLKVPWKYILISVAVLTILLYVAFVLFLKVKLPAGILY